MEYFDACVYAPLMAPAGGSPRGLAGAVLFGADAPCGRAALAAAFPDGLWRHAEPCASSGGSDDARRPVPRAAVLDLQFPPEVFHAWAREPEALRRLVDAAAGPRLLRLYLPPGTAWLALAKQFIKRLRDLSFWVDPFVHGPATGWQGHVRLAEYGNVVLTTLGLAPPELTPALHTPAPSQPWTDERSAEALEFVVGEVGAARLLYASGWTWDDLCAGRDRPGREWLAAAPHCDAEERALVFLENARTLLGAR